MGWVVGQKRFLFCLIRNTIGAKGAFYDFKRYYCIVRDPPKLVMAGGWSVESRGLKKKSFLESRSSDANKMNWYCTL